MTEFYKYLYGLSAAIMKEAFTKRILKYDLQSFRVTFLPNPKHKKCDINMLAYKAVELWSTLLARYKNLSFLDLFKSEIKNWNCSECQSFVEGLGFINKIKGNCQEMHLSIDKYSGCV